MWSPQTRKLFRVCAIRHIPIFTFINKMDRETKDPLELCEEVERELGIDTYAVNWPIGSGKEFQGVYDREKQRILFFQAEERGKKVGSAEVALDDPALEDMIGAQKGRRPPGGGGAAGAGREFDMEAVRNGTLSPVFFGSALTTFGVEPFLEEFLRMTTPPLPRVSDQGGGGCVQRGLLRLRVQDPGQYEQWPTATASPSCASAPASLSGTRSIFMSRATKSCASHSPSR